MLIWLMLAGVIYLWVIDGRVKKEVALHTILAFGISYITALFLKIVFQTNRPFVLGDTTPLTLLVPQDFAFPSAHTAMAFAMAVTVWLHNKKTGTVFLALALLVGVARVWANVHWPIDILGGAVLGSAVALAVERIHLFKLLSKQK